MPSPSQHNAHHLLTPTALVITSQLLRHDNPNLSRAIEQALQRLNSPLPEPRLSTLNNQLLRNLQARTVGEILAALTLLGQDALQHRQQQPERVALLHELLDEWVALAEWILQRSEPPTGQRH